MADETEVFDVRLAGGGLDAARVASVTLVEAMSAPTRAVVDLWLDEPLDLEATLRAEVTIEIVLGTETSRRFHLVVTEVALVSVSEMAGGTDTPRHAYEVVLSHARALTALRSDVRMFQDKSAKEIVAEVLDAAAVKHSFALQRDPVKRIYTVQYGESDFDFVARLLEDEGIWTVELHDEGGVELQLGDTSTSLAPVPGEATLRLIDGHAHGPGLWGFTIESVAVPEAFAVRDYDPAQPNLDLLGEEKLADPATTEWFEAPAGFTTPGDGKVIAHLRAEEAAARRRTATASSNQMQLAAGATLTIEGAAREGAPAEWLITRVEHRWVPRPEDTGARGGEIDGHYQSSIRCVPKDVTWRPPRVAPRPRVQGGQPVVVTGPAGSEIHPDELGRMKAKFFWDRLGPDDDKSSCWMRVAQLPIGQSMAVARVGWEMMVVHLEGDPDRPLAVARMYNAEKVSPYGYPGSASQMALQTPTSPGGGSSNEIRLSDGGGGQELFLNASKDYDATTQNNKTETISGNETIDVAVDRNHDIGVDLGVTIGGDHTRTVGGDEGLNVTSDRVEDVGGSETLMCADNVTVVVEGSDSESVGGSHITVTATGIDRTTIGSQTVDVAGSMIAAAVGGIGCMVAGAKSVSIGGAKIAAAGDAISTSAVGAMAITVGGVCLAATPANFSSGSKGPNLVTVGGVVLANAASKVSFKSKKIDVKVGGIANFVGGGGILTLTAGSASFTGLVKTESSGALKIKGATNLVG